MEAVEAVRVEVAAAAGVEAAAEAVEERVQEEVIPVRVSKEKVYVAFA